MRCLFSHSIHSCVNLIDLANVGSEQKEGNFPFLLHFSKVVVKLIIFVVKSACRSQFGKYFNFRWQSNFWKRVFFWFYETFRSQRDRASFKYCLSANCRWNYVYSRGNISVFTILGHLKKHFAGTILFKMILL